MAAASEASLLQCCDFVLDGTHGSPERVDEGIPVLSAQNIGGGKLDLDTERYTSRRELVAFRKRLHPKPGDVALSIVGTIGKVACVEVDVPFVLQRSVAILRPTTGLTVPRYLYHVLSSVSVRQQLTARTNRSAQAGVYLARLKTVRIPLPVLSEQRRIVEILDQADAIRKKRAEADALMERVLPALFYQMFGDPATNPRGWEMVPLGKAVRMVSGGTPSKADVDFWRGNIPWVSPKDMRMRLLGETQDHITEAALAGSATAVVPTGTVLVVVRSGILAHKIPMAITTREMAINQDMKAFVPADARVDGVYLLGLLMAIERTLLSCVKHGATVHSLDSNKLASISVPLPDPASQSGFARAFWTYADTGSEVSKQNKLLGKAQAVLLHRAFTGELTAKWREKNKALVEKEMAEQKRILEGLHD